MADAFQALADAVASLLGFTPVTCSSTTGCGTQGLILGFVVILIVTVVLAWALGDRAGPMGLVISTVPGYIVSVIGGWIPAWTVLFIVLVIATLLLRPFGESSAGA